MTQTGWNPTADKKKYVKGLAAKSISKVGLFGKPAYQSLTPYQEKKVIIQRQINGSCIQILQSPPMERISSIVKSFLWASPVETGPGTRNYLYTGSRDVKKTPEDGIKELRKGLGIQALTTTTTIAYDVTPTNILSSGESIQKKERQGRKKVELGKVFCE